MSTKLTEIAKFLKAEELKYTLYKDKDYPHIAFSFETDWYVDPDGEKALPIHIYLALEGEVVNIVVPGAFLVGEGHFGPAAFAACVIQARTRYVQFEFDHEAQEIQPCIEIPLMDGQLTQQQLSTCLYALLHVVDGYADVLRRACEDGEIDFDLYHTHDENDRTVEQLTALLSEFTPEQIDAAVEAAKKRR